MLACTLALGCPSEPGPGGNDSTGTETGIIPPAETTEGQSTTPGTTAGTSVETQGGSATSDPTADTGSGTASVDTTDGSTGNDPGNPLDCSGTIYACGNIMERAYGTAVSSAGTKASAETPTPRESIAIASRGMPARPTIQSTSR